MQDPRVMEAGELVAEGMCTPQCLLAMGEESRGCSCRCRGKFHGSVAHTEIPMPEPAERWWEIVDDWRDLSHVPCVNHGKEHTKLWRNAWAYRQVLGTVETQPPKRGYIVKWDASPTRLSTRKIDKLWDPRGIKIINSLSELLLKYQRVEAAWPAPSSYISLYTFKNLSEARLVCWLVEECFYGMTDTTERAIAEIQGKPWPF